MKILGLYNNKCAEELFDWLKSEGHEVILCTEPIDENWCGKSRFDLAISYTYRYIIKENIIELLDNNVVNIHNSFLPWNRGADPNIWSIVDETPRGVTLHYIDSDLDKGFIIAQKLVEAKPGETLKSSYDNLDMEAKKLFKESFRYYDYWASMKKKAIGKGSYHSLEDGKKIKSLISSYDMLVTDFKNKLDESGILS
jgi:methionyl-tRNA formyltransferase